MLGEKIFDANGVSINYAVGPASGPPLVLLHGIAERWGTFSRLIPHLTTRWQVFALDLRGHGKSGRAKNRYAIDNYAEDIICFLESLFNAPVVIAGHSLGALISIYLAARQPKLVKSLALIDPPLHLQHTPLKDIPNGPYQAFQQIIEVIRTSPTVSAIEQSLNTLHPEVNPEIHRERAEVLSQVDPDALMTTMDNQHLVGLNLDTLLMQAECPTLLIQGNPELGAALFHEDMNRALTLLRHGASLSIPDGGHMLHLSHPEAIAKAITDFCDQRM